MRCIGSNNNILEIMRDAKPLGMRRSRLEVEVRNDLKVCCT